MMDDRRKVADPDVNPYASPGHSLEMVARPEVDAEVKAQAVAHITFTPNYLIEALDRYRSVRYGGRIWSVGWAIGVAAFAFSALGAIWLGNYAGAVFLGAFTGLLAVAQRVDNWWAKRAFRSTPHLEELTLEFSAMDTTRGQCFRTRDFNGRYSRK